MAALLRHVMSNYVVRTITDYSAASKKDNKHGVAVEVGHDRVPIIPQCRQHQANETLFHWRSACRWTENWALANPETQSAEGSLAKEQPSEKMPLGVETDFFCMLKLYLNVW